MMNIFGAVLLTAAGFYIGFAKARELKVRVSTLRAVCMMIEIIKSEISSRRSPMDELFVLLAKTVPNEAKSFTLTVHDSLSRLGENSFSEIWNKAAESELHALSERSVGVLRELGSTLGRYDADMQTDAADRALILLSNELQAMEAKVRAEEKMYIALGGGLSMIASLMLI